MIKNNKGFVVTEVLIISTVVIGILIFMYAQFKNINRSYQYSFKYDTVQGMYLTNNIVNYINDGSYDILVENLNNSGLGYLDITECSVLHFTTSNYCQMLFDKSEVEQVLFVKENLIDLKTGMFDLSEDMKEYINNITTSNAANDYRVIIKFKNQTFATMRFNKGENYVSNGLIVHLDAINNTGNGHSNDTTIWKDLSGNGNDATLYKNPIWSNNSIAFDGSTNYARIDNTANMEFANGITWEMRLKIISLGTKTYTEPFGNWNGAGGGIHYVSTNKFTGQIYSGSSYPTITSSIISNIGEYYTVTYTYDNTKATLYINGIEVASQNYDNLTITASSAPLALGGNPNPNSQSMDSYSNVEFENVLIYNRALTAYEVLKNYQIDESRF